MSRTIKCTSLTLRCLWPPWRNWLREIEQSVEIFFLSTVGQLPRLLASDVLNHLLVSQYFIVI